MKKQQLTFRVVSLSVFKLFCYSPSNLWYFFRCAVTFCLCILPQSEIETGIYYSIDKWEIREAILINE